MFHVEHSFLACDLNVPRGTLDHEPLFFMNRVVSVKWKWIFMVIVKVVLYYC